MKFIFASDSFKGTLSSSEIHHILKETALQYFPAAQCQSNELGDGGEGTVAALAKSLQGNWRKARVHDPLGRPCMAQYFLTDQGTAIMEMAQASGFTLLSEDERNPLLTSSFGTGEMMLTSIRDGATSICIGIGGSATNDGGIGMLAALGVRFLDDHHQELIPVGENLGRIRHIDVTTIRPEINHIPITVMCDVNNPLLGTRGATMVYGPQKGCTPETLTLLENGMSHFLLITQSVKSLKHTSDFEGAGAAGGLGYAFRAYLGATLCPGIETVLELLHFDELAKDADLIITGEGRLDAQSHQGKLISGILKVASHGRIPVLAIVGDKTEDVNSVLLSSLYRLYALTDTVSRDQAINQAAASYRRTACDAFHDLTIRLPSRNY